MSKRYKKESSILREWKIKMNFPSAQNYVSSQEVIMGKGKLGMGKRK